MISSNNPTSEGRRPVRLAVVLAALAVAACFGAAFTFVGEQPAQAGDSVKDADR